ncbi:MAG: exo-alpha-sialidase [Akkermansiaceae bacterium]|nr:exo-alpha-sialidase [Akkermansiaceae bacterium]
MVRTKKGADLLHRIGLRITGFTFEDGDELRVSKDPDYSPARLAHPIHKRGQHDCHTFRIPAIARANNGDLLAVYDMRYNSRRDLQEDIDIGLSVSKDGGQTWSEPRPIMDMGTYGGKPQKENGCSDACMIVDRTTCEVFVTACWTHGKPNTHQWAGKGSEPGHGIHQSTQFMAVRSVDHGQTWSEPDNWTKALKDPSWHLFAPAPGNGITMSDGTLVIPTQGRDAKGLPFSNLTWSRDHGKTWHVSSHARDNTTECAVVELSDGSLMLNMRDNRNHRDKSDTHGRAVATTRDLGKTWNKHSSDHGALPEPVCMASLVSHQATQGKQLLFFSNPHHKKERARMTIRMSLDDGKSWPEKHHILLDSKGGAYSSLVMVDDQTLGILYESSAADMIFQKIPLADFSP